MTGDVKHARLAPSASERWLNCPGSARLVGDREDESNAYMREGTAAHEIAAAVLKYGNESALQSTSVEVEGRSIEVTDEMRSAVSVYVDFVRHIQRLHQGTLFVEQRVDLNALNLREQVFGTSDAFVVSCHHRALDIFDFKYGQGVFVRAAENTQLMIYLIGVLLFIEPNLESALAKFDTFTVHIVQPRAPSGDGPIRSWEVSREEIRDFAIRVRDGVWAIQNDDAPLNPGEWCRFCPVRASCPALKKYTENVAMTELVMHQTPEPMPAELLTMEQVSDLLRKVPVIEAWISALRQKIEAELRAGRSVPGWKLVAKRATRQWKDPAELLEWAVAAGVEVYNNPELKSPAQVEKDIGKKNLPEELYESKSSGETLVPESDTRPEVSALPPAEETANQLYLMRGDE